VLVGGADVIALDVEFVLRERGHDVAQEPALARRGVHAQVLIRWNLQLETVPLPKANRPNHLEENLDVFDFELSDAHMEQLNDLNEQWSSLGRSLQYL
jgi:diketogulonate reductase-like aldo/keto reductase